MAWEDVKDVFRPQTVHPGVMKVDEEACTACGLCVLNCVFRCFETDDRGIPYLRDGYMCFSCFNCQIACPVDAISIVENYHVDEGYYATAPHPLPVRMPIEPRDANGKPTEWNAVERVVLERRSVRNYRDRPVPEPSIRRVLEAGRFAPSGGNCQNWQFVVVTDKALINEMNEVIKKGLKQAYDTYMDDEKIKAVAARWEADPARAPSAFDPRPSIGGGYAIGNGLVPALLGAPVVILLCSDQHAMGAATAPQIAAQNMTLVAKSLGIGSCYVGFAARVNASPELLEKLGIRPPFRINTSLVMGYPKFRQEGLVHREFRPIIWHREGASMEIEECQE